MLYCRAMSFLEQCLALLRWKRLIFWNTVIVAAAALLVALLLPKWYRASASVFPPEDDSPTLGSLTSMINMAALGGNRTHLPVLASPSDLFAAILNSRSVREVVVDRHGLLGVYKVEDMDRALKVMRRKVDVNVGREGVVTVTVLDKDPRRAAGMAGTFMSELDRVNREKRTSSARVAREFIERRLEENRHDLAAAEDSLRRIQEDTGVLAPEDQLRAVINAAAQVQVQLIFKEVELSVLRDQLGMRHPGLRSIEREVEALRSRMSELDFGPAGSAAVFDDGARTGTLDVPIRNYPGLTLEYLRALRALKIQEAIFELLTQQYEQYRIQEMRDTPTVQILDEAAAPTLKARPIRWLICVSATLAAFLLSVLLASILENLSRMRRDAPGRYLTASRMAEELGLGFVLRRL